MARFISSFATSCCLVAALGSCTSWRQWWGDVPGSGMPNSITLSPDRNAGPERLRSQPMLSSMRQWEKVAGDVATGLCVSSDCAQSSSNRDGSYSAYGRVAPDGKPWTDGKLCVSVSVPGGDHSVHGAFRTVLTEGVIRGLLSEGARVYARSSPDAPACDHITIRTVVTQLNGATHAGYYAGQLTALAQGVVVVRNVSRAATEPLGVGTVALGELAYWLSPNYLTRHPMAEVAISVSQIGPNGQYRAQYTNVYYINAKDMHAYTDPKGSQPDNSMLSDLAQPYELALPPVPASVTGTATAAFTGQKTAFGIAGSSGAELVGATADGTAVFGNVQFEDCRWHVARMAASKAVADLGSMGGFAARATSVSDDGKVIVGLVELTPQHWSAFLWKSADGGPTIDIVAFSQSFPHATVRNVLVSGNGFRAVANLTVQGGVRPRGRFVSWSTRTNGVDDPLNAALKAYLKDHPSASCAVVGLAKDGTGAAVQCDGSVYIWHSPASEFGDPASLGDLSHADVVATSLDLGSVLVRSRARQTSLRAVNDARPPHELEDLDFTPGEISADGQYVGGMSTRGAALWNVSSPHDVLVTRAGDDRETIAGTYLGGTLLLINAESRRGGCDGGPKRTAFISGPP